MALYETLQVSVSASVEEIKRAYRRLVLRCHPDKLAVEGGLADGSEFRRVQTAWEVLGNPESRGVYDDQLKAQEALSTGTILDELCVEEMDCDKDEEGLHVKSWPCRCGDTFIISHQHIQTLFKASASLILPCRSCSFCIRLHQDQDGGK